MFLFLFVYDKILIPIFFLFLFFFFFILNKTTSCKNKMSLFSESNMMSKGLQNSDLIYYNVNLMTMFLKLSSNIVKYLHLSPSRNRTLFKHTYFTMMYQKNFPPEKVAFHANKTSKEQSKDIFG